MKLIELRNAVTAAIDASSIMSRAEDEYFCASVEYSKFEYHETLEVNFYTHDDSSVFYTLEHDFERKKIAATRRCEGETERTVLTYSKALKELRNNLNKIGVNFNGEYL